MKPNQERAELTLRALAALGVRTVVVAPGGRNSPLVAALQAASGFEVHWFFEERSAAFFALAGPVPCVKLQAGTRPRW